MSLNTFELRKHEDFEILDAGGNKVGEVRIKPSGILWKPKNSRCWFGVNLKIFSTYMEKEGKQQDK